MPIELAENISAHQQTVTFVCSLFVCGALWLWHAQRRGLYARRCVWTVFGVEVLQVAAILAPAYIGGWAPLAMALVLATLGAREAWAMTTRAWPHRRGRRLLAVGVVLGGFAAYAWLAMRPQGFAWVLIAYGITEVHDVAAWLAGGALGRTPMAPTLSPSKTWEGEIAGTLAGMAFASVAWWLLPSVQTVRPWLWVPCVLALGVAGDLAGSYIKRVARQKDFADWVPTQGGALDLYDALIFVAPMAAAYHWLWGGGA